ncbi:ribosome biogenesis regulatory protein, partial [Opisthorchis viverrini]
MSYRIQLAEVDLGNLLFEDKAPLEFDSSGSIYVQMRNKQSDGLSCRPCLGLRASFLSFGPVRSNPEAYTDEPHGHWFLATAAKAAFRLLPKPTFRLPREKRIPAVRDLTRWERFAKLKGIKNKKKSRKVWDPTTQSWRPRWGKDRINAPKDKWFIEFAKLTKEKNERRAKNELQRLRNIARVVKPGQAPPVGVLSESQGSRNELSRALSIAKVSDASMGRFNAPLDERKISKKTEKKMKPRLKLSQVVGSKSTKKSAKTRKPPAKKKPMKKKGSRTDLSLTGSTVIKISGWRQPNSENSIFRHENFFIPPSKYQWNLVKHRLNFIV